jgi:PhoH-like ATPase
MSQLKKIYVIDTNVLLSDPRSIHKFAEHRIHIPFIVLEELDNHKKGFTDLARNAREATRQLEDSMTNEIETNLYLINNIGGTLQFTTRKLKGSIPSDKSNDNIILAETLALGSMYPEFEVILVSRDINMRVKAKSFDIPTEDYKSDQVDINDRDVVGDSVHSVSDLELSANTIDRMVQNYHSKNPEVLKVPPSIKLRDGMIIVMDNNTISYRVVECFDDYCEIKPFKNLSGHDSVWGVRAKNREQNIALNLLTDPGIQLVAISGAAGSGKTLTAVAAALSSVFESKDYESIMFVKEVNMAAGSEEIGFLPGTKIEKIQSHMGPLFDNLKSLTKEDKTASREKGAKPSVIPEQIIEKIEIETPGFLRGRSIKDTYIIIDEVQNLSPSQLKLIITRAGEGSKIVLLGNVNQIDSAYLSASSNGFTNTIKKFGDWYRFGYIELIETVRSELADEGVKRLGG